MFSNRFATVTASAIAAAAFGLAAFAGAATASASTVDDAGYFTNGYDLGMRLGDIVWVFDTDTSDNHSIHRVVTANSTGSVSVSANGLAVT